MPPPRGAPRPPPPQSPANPDHSNITISTSQTDDYRPRHRFYNATFFLHRVSPLYLGPDDNPDLDPPPTTISEPRLRAVAQRLRDVLVGDVVRGVEVGLSATDSDSAKTIANMGSLEAVMVRPVEAADLLDVSLDKMKDQYQEDEENLELVESWRALEARVRRKQGLAVELVYEHSRSVALLLPNLSRSSALVPSAAENEGKQGQFLWLPVMLMRMPALIRAAVTRFLEAEFDCKVSPSRCGTRTMVGGLERWMETMARNKKEQHKDLLVGVGFNTLTMMPRQTVERGPEEMEKPGLRTIDIILPWSNLPIFWKEGKRIEQEDMERRYKEGGVGFKDSASTLAGKRGLREEGWDWRDEIQQPFFEALSVYTKRVTEISLFHPAVRIIKVACSGFVMGDERIKIFPTMDRAAVVDLLGILCEKSVLQQLLPMDIRPFDIDN
ncbi:kinetochore complex Sim4 subunit Fta1-domain-containing protein [Cercophora samala]|uniref:Kinetochore complex Sim4 subunit Fta1-domain-containing protein n=1 Tax=Cercophora samala TaxID=330535 RepID=A0AA39ZFN0_9PEZI|nr:kinetochore complex Sim4 subunit Fta1-domain-containing protein [Cercophora samala]